MRSPLDSQLVFVTGKGGVGKTTIAAACGLLAAERGLQTIVVEVGRQSRVADLFEHARGDPGEENCLRGRLWSISIDPDKALLEWLQALGGRVSGRLLASSSTFQYFAAAAPGARELVSMVKIWELTQERRWERRGQGYERVIVDAPATGHALGLLGSPRTFGAIARVGPIAGQARALRDLLEDQARTAYVAVTHASEMAVTEALELQDGIERELGRSLSGVIANGLLPERFRAAELEQVEALVAQPVLRDGFDRALLDAAAGAARSIHTRSRSQRRQLARLRRRGLAVHGVPFMWDGALELSALERIAAHLARRL